MKIIRVIFGFITAILPLILAGIFGILIYNEIPNILGTTILFILVGLAIWSGIGIFKMIQVQGVIGFNSALYATPDLDNLEPSSESVTKLRTPTEIDYLFRNNQNLFIGGISKIFGDRLEKTDNDYKEIKLLNFNNKTDILTIELNDKTKIIVEDPGKILESPNILRILSAQRVTVEFSHKHNGSNEKRYFKRYEYTSRHIIAKTNIDWKKPVFNVSAGQDALTMLK